MRMVLLVLGGAVVLFIGFAIWQSRANDRQSEISHPPIGQFVTVNGTRVHYLRKGQGPVVILLHGAGGNLRDFTFQLVDKLARDYTVIAFDRPGHGYTDTLNDTGESPAEQAALLAAASQQLGITKAIIGGYSYGGAVALAWALDFPEMTRGLLLMSAVSNPWIKPPSYLYELAAGKFTGPVFATAISGLAPEKVIGGTLDSLFAPQKAPEGYREYIGVGLSIRKVTLRANGKQVNTLLPHIRSQSQRYPELTMPIEIIHGGKDTTVPPSVHAEVLARQLPQSRLTILPDLGHNTQHYAHAEIVAAIERLSAQ